MLSYMVLDIVTTLLKFYARGKATERGLCGDVPPKKGTVQITFGHISGTGASKL